MAKYKIELSKDEVDEATKIANLRHYSAEKRGYRQSDGSKDRNALLNHQRAAIVQFATSRFMGVRWVDSTDTYGRTGNVNYNVDVFSSSPGEPLRIKKKHEEFCRKRLIVSASLVGKDVYINGYIYGADAMIPKYFRTRYEKSGQPEWVVPISDLKSPYSLRKAYEKVGDR